MEARLKERKSKDWKQESLLNQLTDQNEQFKRDLTLIGEQLQLM